MAETETETKTKTKPFDAAPFLETDEEMALYLQECLEEGDPALAVIARAQGMSALARKTGLARESLYRALSDTGNPEFATVLKVVHALGLQLQVTPRNVSHT